MLHMFSTHPLFCTCYQKSGEAVDVVVNKGILSVPPTTDIALKGEHATATEYVSLRSKLIFDPLESELI